jgi:DNA-binding FadR family transcriptional regulator
MVSGAATAVDACEREVRRSILSGELKPGDRLPPERTLAEQLGVNRTTLRGALGRLASARLLTVRQGSGYVVQDYREVAGLELLPELAELAIAKGEGLEAIVRDLLEVRRRLAALVFERLAEGGAPDAAARVERAVERFAQAVAERPSSRAIAEADLEVTAELLAVSQSAVLNLCLNPVTLVVMELAPLREAIYAEPETNVAAYRLLVQWLRNPIPEAAAAVEKELEARDARTVRHVAATIRRKG